MTELQTRWWLDFVETLKTRSDTIDLDEMWIWLGTDLLHKTPESIGRSSLVELGRCLDDRLTLSDKELHAVAYGSDTETEEQDLEKVGKDNGGKSQLFNLKDSHFIRFIKLNKEVKLSKLLTKFIEVIWKICRKSSVIVCQLSKLQACSSALCVF